MPLEITHYNLRQTLIQFAYTYNYYKCCSPYYKMRRMDLSQNAAMVITKCAHYYKMPQWLLQNA